MKTVYLKDLKSQAEAMIDPQQYNNISEAIEVLIDNDLKYDVATGKLKDSRGIRSEYVDPSDVNKNPSVMDVLVYEFLPFIKNECKRIDYFRNQGKTYYY